MGLHIVTGGTGFVGSAVILELLRSTDAHVVGLTRPGKLGAWPRLQQTLEHAARLYGYGSSLDGDIASRCEAVAADVCEPSCGIAPSPEWAGAELWHCAASLQFLDRFEQQIFRTNVNGSRHVAQLAVAAKVETLNMVSTAYVAGTRAGVIEERAVDSDLAQTNNHYERSKIAAEAVITQAKLPRVRVLRPGIVIGHSQTHAALNYNGLYGFLRGIHKFRRLMERTQRELGDRIEVRMIVDPKGTLNLIPVDHVALDAVALARANAGPGYYHLTATHAPASIPALEVIFGSVGMRPPIIVDSRESFTWLDEKFNSRVDFYSAYLVGPKQFSREQINRHLPASPSLEFEIDPAKLAEFCRWYVDGVLTHRKPMPVTR
ncbi:Male sterility protein [Enhygromyxa salina]|uniref:Male sterility protein n=2 Tax=Enhygromyxa salina TaxID=215803 RepID=A0A0C2D4C9_9BACT|nr:Male sterility protein [Enhygromyxa salina]